MRSLLGSVRRAADRLWFELWRSRRGGGQPVDVEVWNQQYRSGAWRHLDSDDELQHYLVLARLVRERAAGSVLDVGCGHGRLAEILAADGWAECYVGVDVSAEAIAQARAQASPGAEFQVGDFETWRPPRTFDAIVFNESLYYASRPLAILQRYSAHLEPGGAFLLSLCRYGRHDRIWIALDRHFDTVNGQSVRNARGQTWDVRTLRPLPPA